MLNSSRVATSAGGAGFVAPKASMTYNSKGKFNISNYTSSNNYILVPNTGSATIDSNGVVTLSSTNAECTIAVKGPKSINASSTSLVGRKPYTYNYNCISSCSAGSPDVPGFWVLQPYACNCGPHLNPAPSGYSGGSGEWRRIVN